MNEILENVKMIHYTDVNGQKRSIEFYEDVPGLVAWRKGEEPSPAKRYRLEDGSIVQIPDNAWAELQEIVVEYK